MWMMHPATSLSCSGTAAVLLREQRQANVVIATPPSSSSAGIVARQRAFDRTEPSRDFSWPLDDRDDLGLAHLQVGGTVSPLCEPHRWIEKQGIVTATAVGTYILREPKQLLGQALAGTV